MPRLRPGDRSGVPRGLRTAFVCGTPLQLIGAIALAYDGFAGSVTLPDLFLRHDFSGSRVLARRLRRAQVFDSVYEVGAGVDGPFSIRGNESDDLPRDPEGLLASQVSGGEGWRDGYGRVFCSYPYDTVKALCCLREGVELMAFDDGLGSYVGNIMASNGGALLPRPTCLYLWCPAIYRGELCDDVRPIMPEGQGNLLAGVLCDVFGVEERELEPYRRARCIYLTQPTDDKPERLVEKGLTLAALRPWRDQTVVRPHPRDAEEHVPGFSYDLGRVPWELLCLAGAIDGDTTLVAAVSTAQLMPKMLMGAEPPVVATLLISGAPVREVEREIVELMSDSYRDPSRVVAPHDAAELTATLSRLLGAPSGTGSP